MTTRRGNFAIWSHIQGSNQGDELVVEAVIDALKSRRPDAHITLVSMDPDGSSERYGVHCVPIGGMPAHFREPDRISRAPSIVRLVWRRLWNVRFEAGSYIRLWRQMRTTERLIIAGSNPLEDDPGCAYRLMKWVVVARLAGADAAIASVGAGPLVRPPNKLMVRIAVAAATSISVRDQSSRLLVAATGSRRTIPIVPDMGWTWSPLVDAERERRLHTANDRHTVGVNIMALPLDRRGVHGGPDEEALWPDDLRRTFDAYLAAHEELILHMTEAGSRILFFSSETQYDLPLQREVVERLLAQHPDLDAHLALADQRAGCTDDVLRQIAQCDLVIASRFHAALLSLGTGCPTVGVAYARKTFDLFDQAGEPDAVLHLDGITGTQLVETVGSVVRRSGKVAPGRDRLRAAVGRQFDQLAGVS